MEQYRLNGLPSCGVTYIPATYKGHKTVTEKLS